MRVIYIADDGTEFDNKYDCEDYEWEKEHSNILSVHFYDKNGHRLHSCFTEEDYMRIVKIVIDTKEEINDLWALADYTGFCNLRDVTEVGTWLWHDEPGTFVKV